MEPTSPSRLRNQRGVVFPSPVVILQVVAVAMAGIAYVATQGQPPTEREVTRVAADPVPVGDPPSPPCRRRSRSPQKPAVDSGKVYVEVYNNSGITGLAGEVAASATEAGWKVVGSDNWYGTIPALVGLLPAQAGPRGPGAGARPRHPPGGARRRPDEARPAHGHPHRRPRLTDSRAGSGSAVTGWPRGVHLRRGEERYAALVAARRRLSSSGSTSTARSRRSSTTPSGAHPPRRGAGADRPGGSRPRGRGRHRPARPAGAGARRARRGGRRHRRDRPASSTCSGSTATSAGPRPTAGSSPRGRRPGLATFERELPRAAAPPRRGRRPRRGEGPGRRRAHPPPRRPRRRVRAAGEAARRAGRAARPDASSRAAA